MSILIEFETDKMSKNPEYWEFRQKFCEREQDGEKHPLPAISIFWNPTSDIFPGSRPKRPTNEHREVYNSEYTMAITINNAIRVNSDNQDNQDNRADQDNHDNQNNQDNQDDDWEPEETEEDRQWRREYIRRYEEDPERIAFRERYRVIIQKQRAWAAEQKAAEARRRRALGRGRRLSEIMQ